MHVFWQQFSINHRFLWKERQDFTKSLWRTFGTQADNALLCVLIMNPDFSCQPALLENKNCSLELHVSPGKLESHRSYNRKTATASQNKIHSLHASILKYGFSFSEYHIYPCGTRDVPRLHRTPAALYGISPLRNTATAQTEPFL